MSWIKMWVFERQFPALMCVKKLNSTYQIPTPKICTGFDFVKNSSKRREMSIFSVKWINSTICTFISILSCRKNPESFVTRFPSKSVIWVIVGCVIQLRFVPFKVVTSLILSKVAASKTLKNKFRARKTKQEIKKIISKGTKLWFLFVIFVNLKF